MSRFSERMGLKEVRSVLQVDDVDQPLRNHLWSLIYVHLDTGENSRVMEYSHRARGYNAIWLHFLNLPIDTVPDYLTTANDRLREYFFKAKWFEVYDFLEFFVAEFLEERERDESYKWCNDVLSRFMSGYRFVSGKLVHITDETHVQSIEDALMTPLTGVKTHLSKALGLLADRESPDASNAIKEAVSAVESICSSIVGTKATLSAALKKLEDAGVKIHPSLKDSWLKAYGYTSDADGIRHALHGDPTTNVDDAVYFLISCSAFISLLTTKAAASGIALQPVI